MQAQEMIEEALRRAGLDGGDVVLVHSDATPAMTLAGFEWWEDALMLLKECFLNVLSPEGTLLVPTFYYDFCKGKPYSHETSPSQVGMFTNSVRLDKRAVRSFHPIFSFAAIGAQASKICDNVPATSLGEDSVFHRLHQMNAKLLFFNVVFHESCTFVHYVEQSAGVDYRYFKHFKGQVSRGEIRQEGSFDHYVRYLDRDVDNDLSCLDRDLLSTGKMRRIFLADVYPVSLVRCNDVYQLAIEKIKADPYYLLKHPPVLARN